MDSDYVERRKADRVKVEYEVEYTVKSGQVIGQKGFGKTINMSSVGVLFTTEQLCRPGSRMELSIRWPSCIDSKVVLRLVARGRVVRSEQVNDLWQTAMEIRQYEFLTQANVAPTEMKASL